MAKKDVKTKTAQKSAIPPFTEWAKSEYGKSPNGKKKLTSYTKQIGGISFVVEPIRDNDGGYIVHCGQLTRDDTFAMYLTDAKRIIANFLAKK